MAYDEVIADLQARLERLEQENRQLTDQLNRRGLFKKVGAAAAGVIAAAAAGQVLGATPAAAADGQPLLIGRPNQGTDTTGDSNEHTGLLGLSIMGSGVVGRSGRGRGGVFYGARAAVQLIPSSATAAPTDGETGDLLVDATGRLWFCKQGGTTATWVQLA
jgi:hypothetical protein